MLFKIVYGGKKKLIKIDDANYTSLMKEGKFLIYTLSLKLLSLLCILSFNVNVISLAASLLSRFNQSQEYIFHWRQESDITRWHRCGGGWGCFHWGAGGEISWYTLESYWPRFRQVYTIHISPAYFILYILYRNSLPRNKNKKCSLFYNTSIFFFLIRHIKV